MLMSVSVLIGAPCPRNQMSSRISSSKEHRRKVATLIPWIECPMAIGSCSSLSLTFECWEQEPHPAPLVVKLDWLPKGRTRSVLKEPSRSVPKEPSRSVLKEPTRSVLEEPSRSVPEELSRSVPKEPSRSVLKEPTRLVPKEQSRSVLKDPF
nr:hypothetical protein [Tanacetum cinerariifolium]